MAKFAIIFIWSLLLTVIMYLAGIVMGLAVDVQGWADADFSRFTMSYLLIAFLTILVSSPVAFFACYGRGIVAPIGFVIVTLISAQFTGLVGLGPWFPWAIPGLLTVTVPSNGLILSGASYEILGFTSLAGVAGTLLWWRFADHK
jgi:ABC-2 type transport system permease protein